MHTAPSGSPFSGFALSLPSLRRDVTHRSTISGASAAVMLALIAVFPNLWAVTAHVPRYRVSFSPLLHTCRLPRERTWARQSSLAAGVRSCQLLRLHVVFLRTSSSPLVCTSKWVATPSQAADVATMRHMTAKQLTLRLVLHRTDAAAAARRRRTPVWSRSLPERPTAL